MNDAITFCFFAMYMSYLGASVNVALFSLVFPFMTALVSQYLRAAVNVGHVVAVLIQIAFRTNQSVAQHGVWHTRGN
jgi:hypothetical protein